jgi:hypothetical protein
LRSCMTCVMNAGIGRHSGTLMQAGISLAAGKKVWWLLRW